MVCMIIQGATLKKLNLICTPKRRLENMQCQHTAALNTNEALSAPPDHDSPRRLDM
eukprot:m.454714 g.454714  ORF g.454714 m.454714 type:complete len:56 (+) comp190163_c0_seq1:88-255(+)